MTRSLGDEADMNRRADEDPVRLRLLDARGQRVEAVQQGIERHQALHRVRFEVVDRGVGYEREELVGGVLSFLAPLEDVAEERSRAKQSGETRGVFEGLFLQP